MRQLFAAGLAAFLAVSSMSGARAAETFTGTISDDMCGRDGHARMRMGPTDADCARACFMLHDAQYILDDGKMPYSLSDQTTAEKFAGQRVRVVGTLDEKTRTIRVESMSAAR